MQPNILYLHSHDAGRYIGSYGHAIPTPHLQRLAEEGVLFRNAFAAAPTCSASRAALLTGQSPHRAGMLGLAHRGWELNDYHQHLIHSLHEAGYSSALCGVQHIIDFRERRGRRRIGYQHVLRPARTIRRRRVAGAGGAGWSHSRGLRDASRTNPGEGGVGHNVTRQAAMVQVMRDRRAARGAARWLRSVRESQPFFLSVGFHMPHRPYARAQPRLHAAEDARFLQPPLPLPDTRATRRDMANYIASVRTMDTSCGVVLDALEANGLAGNTLVIATTDHGPAFPGMKCTLTDHGLGVYLIIRGPSGFQGGRVVDGMVSHLDLYPTLCELLDIETPPWLQGTSLLPLVRGEQDEIHTKLFGEVTYHVAYEPMRSIRTLRWRYIRRFHGDWPAWVKPVLPNTDEGPSKRLLLRHGWGERAVPPEYLFDLVYDPTESRNLAEHPDYAEVKERLTAHLYQWMVRTDDPLLRGPVFPPDDTHPKS